ncbi:hypothetical protein [Actinomadura barringtoniae]|nr:hypothetical protein [Actinomadura barringtoniae]
MPESDVAETPDYMDLLDSIKELIDEYTRAGEPEQDEQSGS